MTYGNLSQDNLELLQPVVEAMSELKEGEELRLTGTQTVLRSYRLLIYSYLRFSNQKKYFRLFAQSTALRVKRLPDLAQIKLELPQTRELEELLSLTVEKFPSLSQWEEAIIFLRAQKENGKITAENLTDLAKKWEDIVTPVPNSIKELSVS